MFSSGDNCSFAVFPDSPFWHFSFWSCDSGSKCLHSWLFHSITAALASVWSAERGPREGQARPLPVPYLVTKCWHSYRSKSQSCTICRLPSCLFTCTLLCPLGTLGTSSLGERKAAVRAVGWHQKLPSNLWSLRWPCATCLWGLVLCATWESYLACCCHPVDIPDSFGGVVGWRETKILKVRPKKPDNQRISQQLFCCVGHADTVRIRTKRLQSLLVLGPEPSTALGSHVPSFLHLCFP